MRADCSVSCPQSDLAAGLSVAAMVVPQGLSYAKLAGLPSVWGLYGAFVPCIIYGLFGSSKQLVCSHPLPQKRCTYIHELCCSEMKSSLLIILF